MRSSRSTPTWPQVNGVTNEHLRGRTLREVDAGVWTQAEPGRPGGVYEIHQSLHNIHYASYVGAVLGGGHRG